MLDERAETREERKTRVLAGASLAERRTKLRWFCWLGGLAALCKMAVFVISISLDEASITYFTGPVMTVAFFAARHELDQINRQLHTLWRKDGRRPKRWAIVLGVGIPLIVIVTVMVFSIDWSAGDGPDRQPQSSASSVDEPSRSQSQTEATSPTAGASAPAAEAGAEPVISPEHECDAVVTGAISEVQCAWRSHPTDVLDVREWDCPGDPDTTYLTLRPAVADGTTWFRAPGGSWTNVERNALQDAVVGSCPAVVLPPSLPPRGVPGDNDLLLYATGGDAAGGGLEVKAVSLAGGSSSTLLYTQGQSRLSDVVVSPDGERLAFVLGFGRGTGELWMSLADGTNATVVGSSSLVVDNVAWADDRRIVADVAASGGTQVTTFDIDTGEQVVLSPAGTESTLVGVQGDFVVYATETGEPSGTPGVRALSFTAHDLATGVVDHVAVAGRLFGDGLLLGNLRILVSDRDPAEPEHDFRILDLRNGGRTWQLNGLSDSERFVAASPAGDRVAMSIQRDGGATHLLATQGIEEGSPREYVALEQFGRLGAVAWTSDGEGLIVEVFPAGADAPGTGTLVHVPLAGAPVSLGLAGTPLAAVAD